MHTRKPDQTVVRIERNLKALLHDLPAIHATGASVLSVDAGGSRPLVWLCRPVPAEIESNAGLVGQFTSPGQPPRRIMATRLGECQLQWECEVPPRQREVVASLYLVGVGHG